MHVDDLVNNLLTCYVVFADGIIYHVQYNGTGSGLVQRRLNRTLKDAVHSSAINPINKSLIIGMGMGSFMSLNLHDLKTRNFNLGVRSDVLAISFNNLGSRLGVETVIFMNGTVWTTE